MSKIAKVRPFELPSNPKSDSNDSKDLDLSSPILLQSFYYKEKETNSFLKQIDKLNLSFSSYSDKYLNLKSEIDKISDSLFINLFKQISLYVEEIERLNFKLKEKQTEKSKESKHKKDHSKLKDLKEIQTYKNTIKALENKLLEKTQNEDRLKKELLSFKRQITFYQDKMQLTYIQKDNNNNYSNKQTNKKLYSSLSLNYKTKQNKNEEGAYQRLSDFQLQTNDKCSTITTTRNNNTIVIGSFNQGQFDSICKHVAHTEQNESNGKSSCNNRARHSSQSKSNIKCKTERQKMRRNKSMDESSTKSLMEHIDKEQIESIAQDFNDIMNQELLLLNKEEQILGGIISDYSKHKNSNPK